MFLTIIEIRINMNGGIINIIDERIVVFIYVFLPSFEIDIIFVFLVFSLNTDSKGFILYYECLDRF